MRRGGGLFLFRRRARRGTVGGVTGAGCALVGCFVTVSFSVPPALAAGTAVVGSGVCLQDPRFQTCPAGCELVEPRLYALLFDLQLASPLLAQFFRARAADSRQTLLDVLGFQIFFELLQAGFQFRLLCLYLSQLLTKAGSALLRRGLRHYRSGEQAGNNQSGQKSD